MVLLTCFWLFLGLVASMPPLEVVVLTDTTFEHDTQAATGQTTGAWCVLFTSSRQRVEHQAALDVWRQLAEDEEKEVIYAVVDVDTNKKLAQRFKGIAIPSAVLLKNRAMFTYSVPDSPDCHEHISGFVSSGYMLVPRLDVPPESAGFSNTVKGESNFLGLDDVNAAKLKWSFVILILALVWKALIFFTKAPPKATAAVIQGPSGKAKKPQPDAGPEKKSAGPVVAKGANKDGKAKKGGDLKKSD